MIEKLVEQELKMFLLDNIKPGQSHAIRGKVLAQMAGYKDTRQIRLAIRELTEQGIPIASGVNKVMGYYIASNQQEYDDFVANMESRLVETHNRLRAFKSAYLSKLTPGQLKLTL